MSCLFRSGYMWMMCDMDSCILPSLPLPMSHVPYNWVFTHLSHVTHIWVMSHTSESCHTHLSHVTHIWVMSHTSSYVKHIWWKTWLFRSLDPSRTLSMSHVTLSVSHVTGHLVFLHQNDAWHGLMYSSVSSPIGCLWLAGSFKLQVSFAKEPYKRGNILQKRPIILPILLTVATPYQSVMSCTTESFHIYMMSVCCSVLQCVAVSVMSRTTESFHI